jgi:hypothetical protein
MNPQPKKSLSSQRSRVIEQIRAAFSGVRLENGIGLMEGRGIDDHEDASTCAKYRTTDEKEDWQKIPVAQLIRCHSSLSFFDPKGMRFHLPAFLIAEMEGTMSHNTEFHLYHLNEYGLSKFVLLSKEQRAAITACMQEMLTDSEYLYSHELLADAINEYWEPKT